MLEIDVFTLFPEAFAWLSETRPLRNATGLVATGRLLRPMESRERRAAVLLEDGRELNSSAIDFLPADFGNVVVLSLDYPTDLPYAIDLRQFFSQSDRLRRAAS